MSPGGLPGLQVHGHPNGIRRGHHQQTGTPPTKGRAMSQVYVSMAMSLDGFITGPHDDAQNPAGINGMRLMDWLGGGGSDARRRRRVPTARPQ